MPLSLRTANFQGIKGTGAHQFAPFNSANRQTVLPSSESKVTLCMTDDSSGVYTNTETLH